MTSRLSQLWGCTANAEDSFPLAASRDGSTSYGLLVAGFAERTRVDGFSSPGLQLASLLEQVRNGSSRGQCLVRGRSEQELTTRVRPDSWSFTECLEHLALTTRIFLPPIAEVLASTPRLTRNRPLRSDILASVVIRLLEPPYRLRHNVLPHLVPKRNDFPGVWKAFLESQEQLSEITRSSIGLAIDTVKIQSPVCCRVDYSVYGALGILLAHQRRHLWQMEQVLHSLDQRAS
jgi:hypothetical protein